MEDKNKTIKVYDIILEIELSQELNIEYNENIQKLTYQFKNNFIEKEKNKAFKSLVDYSENAKKAEKIKLNFVAEAYDHNMILNGKIKDYNIAKEFKSFLRNNFEEKVVVSKEEILFKIDGIGTFKGINSTNIKEGKYNLKTTNVEIEEKESKITGIAIIGDTRREIVENIIKNLEIEDKLFSSEQYKCLLKHPNNPITNSHYKGVNRLRLGYTNAKKGYSDVRWISFKQAKENNYKIKKGEKGTICEQWTFTKKEITKDENGKIIEYNKKLDKPYSSYFTLFNAEQIEGIPPVIETNENKSIDEVIVINDLIASSKCNIERINDTKAYYNPILDVIKIPNEIFFLTKEDYLETLLHEMCHSTGSNKMTSRHEKNDNFLKEELTTEIATVFLKSNLNLNFKGNHIEDHSVYNNSYIKMLESNYHEFFRMCAEAEKIAEIISQNYQSYLEKKNEKEVIKNPCENLKDSNNQIETENQYKEERIRSRKRTRERSR